MAESRHKSDPHIFACPRSLYHQPVCVQAPNTSKHLQSHQHRLRIIVNMCNASMQNEPPALEFDQLPTAKSVGELIAALALDPAYSFPDFTGTLNQLKGDNIEALATDTRYNLEVELALTGEYPASASTITRTPCKVDPNPARGSYNLIFFIDFDDGKSWVLKVSANGHSRCWDEFAAGALESEAFTMRWIREKMTIPLPEVYGFDSSMDNAIGCPYIMMEYIKGQSLYEGWFNPQASPARLEQFRARALQTIAAAMVQLHNFRFHTSGSLRFGPDGKPYEFQSAKVVDFLGTAAESQFNTSRDVWFAQKGPFKNPMDFLLFNLNRRDLMYSDSARVRGFHESLRLFTQWTLEPVSGDPFPFVLGHPDFDLQNILVKEDGTLCGILDWDGVGAVPHTVGCLKYPLWLTRDWEPSNYNYDAATGGRKLKSGRWENSPNENQCYRAMYAQFIEAELSHQGMDKSSAKITRLSLLAGVLESADTIPDFLCETIQNLYGKIGEALGEEPYELDGGFGNRVKVSNSEEVEEEVEVEEEEEEEQEEEEWQDAAEEQAEAGTEPTELGSFLNSPAEEARQQIDCERCRAAQILESSKFEDGTPLISSNFSPIHTRGIPQHSSIKAKIVPTLEVGNVKGDNPERTVQTFDTLKGRGTKLLSWMAQKLREAAEAFYVSADGHARIEQRRSKTSQRDLAQAKAMYDSKVEPTPMNLESKLEHSEDCPRNKKPIRASTPENQDDSSMATSGDAWARIGRMVQNWGIPLAMIEDHEADIAELIVQKMKEGQDRAQTPQKADALRATNATYETQRDADIAVAELAGDQIYETTTRELKKALGIGPPLAKAQSTREFKPVDMEIARLDPAIIAAKKSADPKAGAHQMGSNPPSVGAEQLNKFTTFEGSKKLCWEGNRFGNASASRNETQALGTPSGQTRGEDCELRSSGPLKDEHGNETLSSEDTSDGGVALDAKQAFAGYAVMDDFQGMNENESSREGIGHYYEQSYITDENNALSSEEEYPCVDNGGFNMNDICVGLGEDTLDEERFNRLRMGFVHVLECTLGLI